MRNPFPSVTHAALLASLLLAAAPAALHAQWKTETYALKGGWNAIWLHGDATHATPAELFAAYPAVLEIWRWNPNPDQIQFTDSPSSPDATSAEWTIWNREDPDEQVLSALLGQSAYLVRCSGASTTIVNVAIAQRPRPPSASWLVSGANFIGLPAATAPGPILSSYFASFPVATTTPAKIYKYIGGDLNATNPLQVSPTVERLDRNTAYWFEAATVGDFTGPLKYELPSSNGLAYGRTGSVISVGVTNRTGSALTLTLSAPPSEAAPANQTPIAGPVPLTRRIFDSATGAYVETPLVGESTVSIPGNSRLNLEFGLDRGQLTGSNSALYASFLRIKDSANLSDVLLPVSAQRSSPRRPLGRPGRRLRRHQHRRRQPRRHHRALLPASRKHPRGCRRHRPPPLPSLRRHPRHRRQPRRRHHPGIHPARHRQGRRPPRRFQPDAARPRHRRRRRLRRRLHPHPHRHDPLRRSHQSLRPRVSSRPRQPRRPPRSAPLRRRELQHHAHAHLHFHRRAARRLHHHRLGHHHLRRHLRRDHHRPA
ncbi:MAG: hypothetical protein ABII82_13235 [Verrucomicrobiota bacterium]